MDQFSDRLILVNNNTLDVPHFPDDHRECPSIEIVCPKLEKDDAYYNVNSNFCKIENVIEYEWQRMSHVNWLAVHRCKPFIAYVIQPEYYECVSRHRHKHTQLDPAKQIIRLYNYQNQCRSLVRTGFPDIVADISFAYNSIQDDHFIKLAAVDRKGTLQIYNCISTSHQFNISKIYEIHSDSGPTSYVRLRWCPYFYDEDEYDFAIGDAGMKLALSTGNEVEVFAIDKLIENTDKKEVDRSTVSVYRNDYKCFDKGSVSPIISLSLSSDAYTICFTCLDNSTKFFSIPEEKQLRFWTPSIPEDDRVSCFFFLDDYNEVLENKETKFWTSGLIGTVKGRVCIWDLSNWQLIQKLVLKVLSDDKFEFEYKIDVTSHALVAIAGEVTFLLLLDFVEVDNLNNKVADGENGNEQDKIKRYPQVRISKISRFQLYNPLISFVVKKDSPDEIDIFWMTQKTIEKCSVTMSKLVSNNLSDGVKSYSASKASFSNLKRDETVKNNLVGQYRTMSGPLARILRRPIENPIISLPSMYESDPIKKSYKENNAARVTPTSQEVANLLHPSTHGPNTKVLHSPYNFMDETQTSSRPNIESSPLEGISQALPKDLVTEKMLKNIEENIKNHLDSTIDSVRHDLTRLRDDLASFRNEVKDSSSFRANSGIIDDLIKKLMHQMNGLFAKGLEEFMSQVKHEIGALSALTSSSTKEFTSHCSSVKKRLDSYESQVQELRKQMKEYSKQQTEILTQLNRCKQYTLNSSCSSPNVRNSSFSYSSPATPNMSHEALERAKLEERIWNYVKSDDDKFVVEGIKRILNSQDLRLINELCDYFCKIKTPSDLAKVVCKDQTIILSFLNHFALSDLKDEKCKISLIFKLLPNLDISAAAVRLNLPRFSVKLANKLKDVYKSSIEKDSQIPMTLGLLQLYSDELTKVNN